MLAVPTVASMVAELVVRRETMLAESSVGSWVDESAATTVGRRVEWTDDNWVEMKVVCLVVQTVGQWAVKTAAY